MPCYITLHGDYLVAQCQRLLNHYAWCREQLIQLKALKEEMTQKKVSFKAFLKNSEHWSWGCVVWPCSWTFSHIVTFQGFPYKWSTSPMEYTTNTTRCQTNFPALLTAAARSSHEEDSAAVFEWLREKPADVGKFCHCCCGRPATLPDAAS